MRWSIKVRGLLVQYDFHEWIYHVSILQSQFHHIFSRALSKCVASRCFALIERPLVVPLCFISNGSPYAYLASPKSFTEEMKRLMWGLRYHRFVCNPFYLLMRSLGLTFTFTRDPQCPAKHNKALKAVVSTPPNNEQLPYRQANSTLAMNPAGASHMARARIAKTRGGEIEFKIRVADIPPELQDKALGTGQWNKDEALSDIKIWYGPSTLR